MAKDLEGLEEGLETNIHIDSLWTTFKKYQIGKLQAIMTEIDSKSKHSPLTMTNRLSDE